LSKTTWYSLKDEDTKERSRDVAREWWIGAVKSLWPVMLARTESGEVRPQNEVQRIVGDKVGIMEGVCSIPRPLLWYFWVCLFMDEW
jgi:hypothetical protein